MKKRATAFLTLMSFIAFSFSCVSIEPVNPGSLSVDSKVIKIEKKSGQIIEFSKNDLGKVYGNSIVGKEVAQNASANISILISEVERAWVELEHPLSILLSACVVGCAVLVFLLQVFKTASLVAGGR